MHVVIDEDEDEDVVEPEFDLEKMIEGVVADEFADLAAAAAIAGRKRSWRSGFMGLKKPVNGNNE